MKICILGPVQTGSYFGGVALFDEELAIGFSKNNCDVVIATNQHDAQNKQLREHVIIRKHNKRSFRRYLCQNKPDIVIASLGYAAMLPKKSKTSKVAYFLHGFFNERNYGKMKSQLAALYQKFLLRRVDYVFANSYFTQMINREFFQINCDKVFHLGVSEEVFELSRRPGVEKEKNSILFVGRLVPAKGTRQLIEAARKLTQQGVQYSFCIAGDGTDKEWMEEQARIHGLSMTFSGRVSQKDISNLYQKSEVFVSLNPSEPFGITYLEALLNNCKIVCPKTGGQVEFLQNLSERVEFVSENEVDSLADGIAKLINRSTVQPISTDLRDKYSFAYVAKQMLEYLSHQPKTDNYA